MSAAITKFATGDLVRFLLARVDDDDDELKRLKRRRAPGASDEGLALGVRSIERLRAECMAKRQIIRSAQHLVVMHDLPAEKFIRDAATSMLRALAFPYASHLSYRSEWRPTAPR